MEDKIKLVVVQHLFCEGPGAFNAEFDRRGVERAIVEIDTGEALPDWRDFDGIVAMGGPMSVNDEAEHPWLVDEKRWLAEAVRAGKPFFGACLGVQMLASALGARVYPLGQSEVGLLEVQRTSDGLIDPVIGALGEEGGKAFLSDAVARHEELGGQAHRLIGSWLDLIAARSGQ